MHLWRQPDHGKWLAVVVVTAIAAVASRKIVMAAKKKPGGGVENKPFTDKILRTVMNSAKVQINYERTLSQDFY